MKWIAIHSESLDVPPRDTISLPEKYGTFDLYSKGWGSRL